MRTVLAGVALAATASLAFAHEGHGQEPGHLHGGDGMVVLAAVAVIALWMWRRKP